MIFNLLPERQHRSIVSAWDKAFLQDGGKPQKREDRRGWLENHFYLEPVVRRGKVEGSFRLLRFPNQGSASAHSAMTPIQGFALAVATSAALWATIVAVVLH
jgi:hypothetical protein